MRLLIRIRVLLKKKKPNSRGVLDKEGTLIEYSTQHFTL